VVETDVAACVSAIPQDRLMTAVEERVCDQSVLRLMRAMLRAAVMESGVVRHPDTGTPQGEVVSPLMCTVYLHRLERVRDTREFGVLVRFADDLPAPCRSRQQAALARLRPLPADLGLAPKQAKTRIVELVAGGEGFDFPGFPHRMVRSPGVHGRRGAEFLAR
jgi:RNA-directed DNA polymerase